MEAQPVAVDTVCTSAVRLQKAAAKYRTCKLLQVISFDYELVCGSAPPRAKLLVCKKTLGGWEWRVARPLCSLFVFDSH